MIRGSSRLAKLERRQDDLVYREERNKRRRYDDARREVDEKAEQLKVISDASTILAGFTMASLVEVTFVGTVDGSLLSFYGTFCALTASLHIIAAVTSQYLLVAIYKFDCTQSTTSSEFKAYWDSICEDDWQLCLKCLVSGVFLFIIVFIELSWINTTGHESGQIASTMVTVLLCCTSLYWYLNIYCKWESLLFQRYKFTYLSGDASFASSEDSQ